MSFDELGWVLWAGTVGLNGPLPDRMEAARAGGYTRLSLSPLDVLRANKEGVKASDIGRRAHDRGLEIVFDAILNWYGTPQVMQSFADQGLADAYSVGPDDALRMCEELHAVSITAVGQPHDDVPVAEIVDAFGSLCDRAAGFGAQVHLEPMPMLAINDLAYGWTIVAGADRPNGGLLVDTWHFFRGNPDFSTLDNIPGEKIFGVQISDAAAEVGGSLIEDTFNRMIPGEGLFDLTRLLGALDAKGALRWVGPEVISPATEAADASEVAVLTRKRIEDLIAETRRAG